MPVETVTVQQAYRFALDPTPRQLRAFASHAGGSRFAYNWGLARIVDALDTGISSVLLVDLTGAELRGAETVLAALGNRLPEPDVASLHTLMIAGVRDLPVVTARPGWYPGLRTIAL